MADKNIKYDTDFIEKRTDGKVPSVLPVLLARRSHRSLTGTPISDEDLRALFEAARWSPSHYNVQNWRFTYSKRGSPSWEGYLGTLWEGNIAWAKDAAALVVVLSKKSYVYNDRTEVLHSHSFEAGAAFMALSLEGTARGLAVHAMGGFDDAKVREVIGLTGNEEYQVEAVLAVGNPKAGGVEYITKRREVEQFTSEGKFVEKVEAKPFF